MDEPALTSRPALKRGCRLSPPSHSESLLFIPEGALRLQGPGRRILELCDGQRTLADLIKQLQSEFPDSEVERISREVISFLKRLQEKAAIEFI
jgi:pyrroloquinoline quinone biosynthesis protein D